MRDTLRDPMIFLALVLMLAGTIGGAAYYSDPDFRAGADAYFGKVPPPEPTRWPGPYLSWSQLDGFDRGQLITVEIERAPHLHGRCEGWQRVGRTHGNVWIDDSPLEPAACYRVRNCTPDGDCSAYTQNRVWRRTP